MRKLLIAFLIAFSFAAPALAAGASLSLTASALTVNSGASFSVAVKAGSGGVMANTIGADIYFPPDLLQVTSVSGASVITIPISKGVVSAGFVSIQGGIQPARILNSNPVGTITFKTLKTGTAAIRIAPSSGVYADDGQGTNLLTSFGSIKITIAAAPPKPTTPPPAVTPEPTPTPATPPPQTVTPPVNEPVTSPNANIPAQNPSFFTNLWQKTADWWQNNKDLVALAGCAALIILGLYFTLRSLYVLTKKKKK